MSSEAEAQLLSFRQAEREYGIPKRYLRELPVTQRDRRSKLVTRRDVEALIARTGRCQGCREPVGVGRTWHQACLAKATNAEISGDPERAAARSDRTTRVMREHWSHEANRAEAGARTRAWAARRSEALARFKAEHDLLDATEVVEAIGPVRWRGGISPKYVLELAREHEVGHIVPGPAGKGGSRRLYDGGDVAVIRSLLKHETLEGTCAGCGKPTYNSVRCRPCSRVDSAAKLTALHEQFGREVEAFKREHGLLDLEEAARELNRARTKVWSWARELGLGEPVPIAMGRSRLLLSDADVAAIRAHIEDLARRAEPGSMVAIRESTDYPAWYLGRFKTTKKFGEYAPAIAAERGVRVGRPTELLESEANQIIRLAAEGRSQRAIADSVGVSRGQVRRVLARQPDH